MAIIPGVYQAKNAISDDSQQGSKFNSIVNAIVNPANTSLLTGFDPVIEEISNPNVGTVVTYTPHTVSGTPPLSLPNSAGQPLESWSVDVLPYQEGTGDPSPDNVRPIHGTDKLTITTAGKNLIQNTATSRTINNVEFTVNTDGSVKVYGTANGTAWLRGVTSQSKRTFIKAGTYTLTGGVSSTKTLYIVGNMVDGTAVNNASVGNVYDQGNGVTITLPKDAYITYQIQINNGTQADDTFYPMFRIASDTDTTFTPYLAPSQTVLTLPQTVYTGTIGSEGGESRTAVYTFTGNETWRQEGSGAKYYTVAPNNGYLVTDAKLPTDNSKSVPIKTSIGDFNSSYNVLHTRANTICIAADARFGITADLYNPDGGTLAGVQVEYELATHVQFPLTSPTIPTPTGTATTWATAEDGTVDSMEVTYLGTV